MKLIHLNLKHQCVLVELGEGIRMYPKQKGVYFFRDSQNKTIHVLGNNDNLVKLIGPVTSLTEKDFEGVVEEEENWYSHLPQYKDYYGTMACNTARESFISAIEAEGWYVNGNPYGDKPKPCGCMGDCGLRPCDYAEWQEAQEKVIDLSNSYIFIKEEA